MLAPRKINRSWQGEPCVVAASGPSLTADVAHRVRMARWCGGWRVLCVNDAYRLLPQADALYACDWGWWRHHDGAKKFDGERFTCHSTSVSFCDDKSIVLQEFDVTPVEARNGAGFSADQQFIHYGFPQPSSGFQAVNLALLMGASLVVLVGFDGHTQNGAHFFGDHQGLRNCDDAGYREFAKAYPADERVLNATPGSSIKAYKFVDLEDVLRDHRMHWNGPINHASAS